MGEEASPSLDLACVKLGVSCIGAFYMICCMFWALSMHAVLVCSSLVILKQLAVLPWDG